MKFISTLVFIFYCTMIQAQCIVNAPYLEDFETGGLGSCVTQDSLVPSVDWFVTMWQTPTGGTGPSGANTGNYYTYIESSSPAAHGDSAVLYTAHINTSTLNVPALYFHYHQYGNDYMQLRVQYKIAGSHWQTVFHQVGSVQQTSTDAYESVYIPLLDAIDTLIQVRFIATVGANDGVSTGAGFAFHSDIALDDIRIDEVISNELALTDFSTPANTCGLGIETVEVEITNIGYLPKDSITINLEWNGTNSMSYFIQNPINGNSGKDTVSFNIDFSNIQIYDFAVYIANNNDLFSSNDTLYKTSYTHSTVNTIPHYNDFENGGTGWYGTGDWEHGQPNGNLISWAVSGQNAFVTNLTSSYQLNSTSYLYSPCFSFSDSINPVLKLDAYWDIETNWDAAWMESSIDDGLSWQKMENTSAGQNWYSDSLTNTNFGWVWNGGGADGSGGWVDRELNLYPFRFDTVDHVSFRFVLSSDLSSNGEGLAIDNFNIIDSCYALTLQPEIVNPTFDVLNNGMVTLQTNGGGGDYTYSWSHGVQGDYFDDLVEGNYTVTVTDFNGCSVVDSFQLINVCSDSMSITFIVDSVVIDQNTQDTTFGSIQAIINHAVPPYTYSWNIGDTTDIITGLVAGFYNVDILDVNGCLITDYVLMENVILNKTDGIEHLEKLQFFPNPTRDILNVNLEFSTSVDLSIKVIDINGRELISLEERNKTIVNTSVDVSSYPNSMYFLQITVDGQRTTKPFVIVK